MYEVFTKLLNMNLAASILVLFVIFLRFVLKKAPKKYICILWAIVALRLICPFSISSEFSAYNMLHQNTVSTGQVEYFEYNGKTEKPGLTFEVPALVNDSYAPDSMTIGTKTLGIYMPMAVYIWGLGVIVMLTYIAVSYWRLSIKVRASIKKNDNIFVCDEIKSPFIFGIMRPSIYIPSGISEEVKENVIAHEKAHIKRFDHLWKPLGFFLLSVYWFNPLMWVAYIFLCKDIEVACDEKVISQMDKECIVSYSEALLSCASQRRMITACPVAFGETDVKGRIKNALNYKKPAFWMICVTIIVCVVVAVCFLTNPIKNNKEEVVFGTWMTDETEYILQPENSYKDVMEDDVIEPSSESNEAQNNLSEVDYMSTKIPEKYQSDLGLERNDGTRNSSIIELVSKYAKEQVDKYKEQGRWAIQTEIVETTSDSAKIRYYLDSFETKVILWEENIQYEYDNESIKVISSDWNYYHFISQYDVFLSAYSGNLEGTGMDYSKNGKGERIKNNYGFNDPIYSVRKLLSLCDNDEYVNISLDTNGDDTNVLILFPKTMETVTVKMIQPWDDSEAWIPWHIIE